MRALALALLAIALAGCGSDAQDGAGDERVTLLLDFTPNAVHAGIYVAARRGYDRDAGVRLDVREPGESTVPVKALVSGRADLAVLDIHDLGLARQEGADLVGVMALVQRPLAAVIAQPRIGSPRALEGGRAGVTGLPSDVAVLRSVVRGAGGDPGRVRTITVGFNAVGALLTGRVDAATAFWNVEGVELQARRPGTRVFKVDDFGAPRYPELVVAATRKTLRQRPAAVRATLAALARGYDAAIAEPDAALIDLGDAVPGLDRARADRQLDAVQPVMTGPDGRFGALNPAALRSWAAWDVRFGILERPPDVARAFDSSFLPGP